MTTPEALIVIAMLIGAFLAGYVAGRFDGGKHAVEPEGRLWEDEESEEPEGQAPVDARRE
jgi:hypothetical protein